MKNIILSDENKNRGIRPLFIGEERCEPRHSFGPYIREHFLIHFVLSGKGRLTDKHGTHKIGAGELFIIRPSETTVYIADADEPWHYTWIGFVGDEAKAFDTERSVYKAPVEALRRFHGLVDDGEVSAEAYISIIYELMYHLFSKAAETPDRLSQIKAYIEYNYMENITVGALTSTFGFERSYLYRMFKARYGIGVKEYIMRCRTERAKGFLESGHTVAETAYLVGYRDEFNFSRAFKKAVGKPPSEFKKN